MRNKKRNWLTTTRPREKNETKGKKDQRQVFVASTTKRRLNASSNAKSEEKSVTSWIEHWDKCKKSVGWGRKEWASERLRVQQRDAQGPEWRNVKVLQSHALCSAAVAHTSYFLALALFAHSSFRASTMSFVLLNILRNVESSKKKNENP